MFSVWLHLPLEASFNTSVFMCVRFFFFVRVYVLCIFCCTLLSTEMFGGLLRPMSFCLAALLWTCTAQKMLSNRAAGAAQTRLKTGQASRNSRRPWRSTRVGAQTHTHERTIYAIASSLCLLVLADQWQNPGGIQAFAFTGTLHVHNAYGRPLCTTFSTHQHKADHPRPSAGRPPRVYLSGANGSALPLLSLCSPRDPSLFSSVLVPFSLILLWFFIWPPARTQRDTSLDSFPWPRSVVQHKT